MTLAKPAADLLPDLLPERRDLAWSLTGAQLRADPNGPEGTQRFSGLASPFKVRAAIGDPRTWGFLEEFQPGAYSRTLADGDQRMLIDHASYYVVSRVSAGTLALTETMPGLVVDSALDEELSYVRDLKANLRNKNLTGMSIGFYVEADAWSRIEIEEDAGEGKVRVWEADLRTITEATLVEVSVVTFPAFSSTEAELKSVSNALAMRGDPAAIQTRAAFRPELAALLRDLPSNRSEELVQPEEPSPPASIRCRGRIDLAMRGLAARYRLPTRT